MCVRVCVYMSQLCAYTYCAMCVYVYAHAHVCEKELWWSTKFVKLTY